MLLDLRFTIVTLSLTAGTFGAALYGMNLKNFMEDSDVGFWFISGLCSVVGVIIATYSFRHLRRVQRLTMWGHGDKVGPLGGRRETDLGTLRLRAGENVGDLIVRERAVARRLAKAERRSDRLAES